MLNIITTALFFLIMAVPASVHALEVRVAPEGFVYLNTSNARQGYFDAMIHNIAIVNPGSEVLALKAARIDVIRDGKTVQSQAIALEKIIGDTKRTAGMAAGGRNIFVKLQFGTEGGASAFLGQDVAFASSAELAPKTALVTQQIFLTMAGQPDSLRITVEATNASGKIVRAEAAFKAVLHQSPNSYHLPVRGTWFMRSIPSITSHHRWVSATEFAVDFFRTDIDGRIWVEDQSDPSNYFAFGEDVLAAEAGTVVTVVNDVVQDRAARIRKDGEERGQFMERLTQYNMRTFHDNFRTAAAGNYVVIRHQGDEYSTYGHLRSGSVSVGVGDHVARGQAIAEVGDTGDSNAVHLHFQVNSGPDAFFSRSVPVTFSDLARGSPETGRHVRATERPAS